MFLLWGCVVDGIDLDRPGFPCNPDGTCRNGLVCEGGVCVRPTEDAGTGADAGGGLDGGTADAGPGPDGGREDAGRTDGGGGDGGEADGGPADGGSPCLATGARACTGCADGTACSTDTSEGVCVGEVCFNGCYVGGAAIPAGTTENGNPCRVCDPRVSVTDFTSLLDGTACTDDGNPCTKDECRTGSCEHVPLADASPCPQDTNPCTDDYCEKGTCIHPPSPVGTACGGTGQCDGAGTCSEGCLVGGALVPAGTVNPNNPCLYCDPMVNPDGWTPRTDGSDCDDGNLCNGVDTCQGGACTTTTLAETCESPPVCRTATGASCDPATGACTYPVVADGTPCSASAVCYQGVCSDGCYIAGTFFPAGAENPDNPCQVCTPAANLLGWTPRTDGTACGGGSVCVSGACLTGCFIDGAYYSPGATDFQNPCHFCNPNVATTSWTLESDGATCGTDSVCVQGDCTPGCYISGVFHTPGTENPSNSCETCQPGVSTSSWTAQANGTQCGSSSYRRCCNGVCVDLLNDRSNCGTCGNVCDPTQTCSNGVCSCPPVGCY